MFFVNDPGPWQSFILRGDNVGRSINEVTQKYLNEQLQFENFISMEQQLQLQQYQNKGIDIGSNPTPPLLGDFLINTENVVEGITTNDNQFQLPLTDNGVINFTIDWGDGTTDTITSYNQAETLHTYTTPGEYYITITSGIIRGWSFGGVGDAVKLIEIFNWSVWDINTTGTFYGCSNLISSATSVPTISTSDLSSTFYGCSLFNGPVNLWDVSGVTNMTLMFGEAFIFNQPLDTWDVSSVNNMSQMFFAATSFNQPLNTWDVSSVINMFAAFNVATSFNQPLNNWDVSNVTNMHSLFKGTNNAFNQNIGNWNIANVTVFTDFMSEKTPANFSTANLNAIYNGWSQLTVQPNITISFGTAKYTAAGAAGRATLDNAPNNWTITDGGQT